MAFTPAASSAKSSITIGGRTIVLEEGQELKMFNAGPTALNQYSGFIEHNELTNYQVPAGKELYFFAFRSVSGNASSQPTWTFGYGDTLVAQSQAGPSTNAVFLANNQGWSTNTPSVDNMLNSQFETNFIIPESKFFFMQVTSGQVGFKLAAYGVLRPV